MIIIFLLVATCIYKDSLSNTPNSTLNYGITALSLYPDRFSSALKSLSLFPYDFPVESKGLLKDQDA